MATKKRTQTKKDTALQVEAAAELAVEAGAEQMLAGAENLGFARDVAREAAGELAAGASDLTRAEDAFVVSQRLSDLSGVVAAAGAVDVAQGAELLAKSEDVAASAPWSA